MGRMGHPIQEMDIISPDAAYDARRYVNRPVISASGVMMSIGAFCRGAYFPSVPKANPLSMAF